MQKMRRRYGILLFLLIGSAIYAQDDPLGESFRGKRFLAVGDIRWQGYRQPG